MLAIWIAVGAELAGKNTDEVKRNTKKANVETTWNVSEDFRATDNAIANAPKNTVPRKRAAAIKRPPPSVKEKLAPTTGYANTHTRRDPATPMIRVARMMLRMYWARVKGPIRICSNMQFFRSNHSWVPAFVPPLITVSVTAPAARNRE